ncbi:hypothetical protein ACIA8E_37985 [Streptomyces sp. NPDC051664]|uniref:hypothetical protein n=1 Tax=Streptomyces sp. NPDC051664 TaxID=3365668 RepID=UPI00379CB079
MRSVKKVMLGAIASLALATGITGTIAGSAAASTSNIPHRYVICDNYDLGGTCWSGYSHPGSIADLRYAPSGYADLNDKISSIQTAELALQTWNDPNWKGTYGYFQPDFTWNRLTYPFNDAISSVG